MPASETTTTTYTYSGYLNSMSHAFDTGVSDLHTQLSDSLTKLEANPSDPTVLAAYQGALSEYNLYRNAQTSAVKAMKDIDSSIVSNFR